ncbi:MAG: FAD-dependent oxidoreductase, partial [Cytophagaceae bacterium]
MTAVTAADVALIGGGLAGLAAALDLAGRGHRVVVVERKQYPFHKVCGEYVSHEVGPYLRRLGADPAPLGPASISRFNLSSPAGRVLDSPLDLGGFGVSRYQLDNFLYKLALARGVEFVLPATVADVAFDAATNSHLLTLADGRQLTARQAQVVLYAQVGRALPKKRAAQLPVQGAALAVGAQHQP